MNKLLVLPVILGLSACNVDGDEDKSLAEGSCDLGYSVFIGGPVATHDLAPGQEPPNLRILAPGEPSDSSYDPTRTTVRTDLMGMVEEVYCG